MQENGDFFGVKCKDGQQSCSLEDARYTRYSLRAPHNATSVIGDPAEFKGKDTRISFVKHPKVNEQTPSKKSDRGWLLSS